MSDTPDSGRREDRRITPRHHAAATALVIRDSDVMRTGIDGTLKDVSAAGVGIIVMAPLPLNEPIKIRLRNAVQRIEKEVRGIVRHVTPQEDGSYRVGVQLFGRLTPLEVSLLRMGIRNVSDEGGKVWM